MLLPDKKARLYTLPKNDILIYVSSLVPESAYVAGYYGDGLLTVGSGGDLEKNKEIISRFEKGAQDAGKNPENMPKAVEISVEYGVDVEASIENLKKFWAGAKVHALYLNKIYTPEISAQNGKVVGRPSAEKWLLLRES